MGRALTNLSFEQWVKHIFDHPVTETAWHFDIDSEWWDYEPPAAVSYLAALFSQPIEALSNYTDAQISQGFWYLVSDACSMYMRNLSDRSVPLIGRLSCIESIYTLFERLFASRCTATLCHLNEKGNPLNSVCYMWWDIIQLTGVRSIEDKLALVNRINEPQERRELLHANKLRKNTEDYMTVAEAARTVMLRILEIESDACRESALHGLGHWSYYYPEFIWKQIDEWLSRHSDIRPELREYALKARWENIL